MRSRSNEPRLSSLEFIDPQSSPGDGWPHATIAASDTAPLTESRRHLTADIAGAGRMRGLHEWSDETYGTSLLVVDRGEIVHEWYAEGLGPRTRFLGASMTKSVLAHLVGRAVSDGSLRLSDPVVDHAPELRGTGYDGPTVGDVVTMTTGVDWIEDHRNPDSLASRLVGCFAGAGDSRELLASVRPHVPPGTRFEYCTADSQVLDWVREAATGRTYADDLARLWSDLGCETDAVVGIDARGVAMAGGAVAATSRDWARIGMLAVDGTLNGRRLLDRDWTDRAVLHPKPFLAPGRLPSTVTTHAGFGYHWWPLDTEGRRAMADGSRGQFTYVDRVENVVVVKTSRWPYDDWLVDRQHRDLSYLGLPEVAEAAVRARTA